jgi:hypothetical protein
VRGWINYDGAFYRSEVAFLELRIDEHLVPMGNAQVQTAARLARQGVGLASRGTKAKAYALR